MMITTRADLTSVVVATCCAVLLPSVTSAQWIKQLPRSVQDSILWSADHERGNLDEWQLPGTDVPGGGILNTGGSDVSATASEEQAHSGRLSAAAKITGAIRARNGKRAVRLMRWTDRPWDRGGHYFPKAAYYSTWMYLPHKFNSNKYAPWDPGDGGWWNVFQFKANDQHEVSTSMFSLGAYYNDERQQIEFGLNSHYGEFKCFEQTDPIAVPIENWFHVEAFYQVSSTGEGAITVWQDGVLLFDKRQVRTAITPEHENAVWGIGNYTDHIAGGPVEGTATIYFDDAIVSLQRVFQRRLASPDSRRVTDKNES